MLRAESQNECANNNFSTPHRSSQKNINVWIDAEQTFRISAGKQDEKKT